MGYVESMSLIIFIPIVVLLVALVIYFGRRHKAGGSGLGDRSDATEPTELRGDEQWKHRAK